MKVLLPHCASVWVLSAQETKQQEGHHAAADRVWVSRQGFGPPPPPHKKTAFPFSVDPLVLAWEILFSHCSICVIRSNFFHFPPPTWWQAWKTKRGALENRGDSPSREFLKDYLRWDVPFFSPHHHKAFYSTSLRNETLKLFNFQAHSHLIKQRSMWTSAKQLHWLWRVNWL